MRNIFTIVVLFLFLSCQREEACKNATFNSELWKTTQGNTYLFRSCMYQNLVESQVLKSQNRQQIIQTLGAPDREENNHLYYTISQEKVGIVPLHTTTLVIQLSDDDTVNWVKIHK